MNRVLESGVPVEDPPEPSQPGKEVKALNIKAPCRHWRAFWKMGSRVNTKRTSPHKIPQSIPETTRLRTPRSQLAQECLFSRSLMKYPVMELDKLEEVGMLPLNLVSHLLFLVIIPILAWIINPGSAVAVALRNLIPPIEEKESLPSKQRTLFSSNFWWTTNLYLITPSNSIVLPFFFFSKKTTKDSDLVSL